MTVIVVLIVELKQLLYSCIIYVLTYVLLCLKWDKRLSQKSVYNDDSCTANVSFLFFS